MDCLHDLVGGEPFSRHVLFIDAPDLADVMPVLGVFDVAVAGKLVALMAVLAPALAVALTGDGGVAAIRLADAAGGEHQIDAGEHVLDSLALVLDAARVHQETGLRLAPPFRGKQDFFLRNAGDPLGPLQVVVLHRRRRFFKAARVVGDELVVEPVMFDELMQDRAVERGVAAWSDRQMQIGGARDRSQPRIDDDKLRAVVARLPDPVSERRKRFTDVRAADHDDFGVLEIGVIIRSAVQAEGLLVSRAGADHAEPAVVIEIARLERDSGELADEVALFIRQRNTREHRKGIAAVLALDALDFRDRSAERVLPIRAPEAGAFGSLERIQQPVGMIVLQVALDAFRTKPAFVERELFPRFEADDLVVFDQQLDAALHPAETAMGLDDLVRLVASGIALARRVVQMRPELGDKSLFGGGECCHSQGI